MSQGRKESLSYEEDSDSSVEVQEAKPVTVEVEDSDDEPKDAPRDVEMLDEESEASQPSVKSGSEGASEESSSSEESQGKCMDGDKV